MPLSTSEMIARFSSRSAGAPAEGSTKPLPERLPNLKWIKSKPAYAALAGDLDKHHLVIILPILDGNFLNEFIWRHWIQSCIDKNYKISLCIINLCSDIEQSAQLSDWITSSNFPVRNVPYNTNSVNYDIMQATLQILRAIINNEEEKYSSMSTVDRFLIATGEGFGDFIPIATPDETFAALEPQHSWLNIIHNFPQEYSAYNGIDQTLIPFKFLCKTDINGIILLRRHVQLLINIPSEFHQDLSLLWNRSKKPEQSYYSTMLSLLDIFQLTSLQSASDISVRGPIYCHYVGYTGSDKALEATLHVLTCSMMHEFRRTGAIFAKHIRLTAEVDHLANWKTLVYEGSYNNSNYILRLGGDPIAYESNVPKRITEVNDVDVCPPNKKMKVRDPQYTTKIVINSNKNYLKCLLVLLQTIFESDFLSTMATEDIIVSISQSEETVPPQFLPIRELIHRCPDAAASMHLFMEDEEIANRNIVVIESTMNSYDWTAKHMLHVFGSHSLIQADYYLYLLDTCKVDKIFWRKVLEKVPRYPRDPFREDLLLTIKPHSSISIFGKGVIRNYANNFERPISKTDGLILEMYERPIFYDDGHITHGITRFGNVSRLVPRSKIGTADWYGTKTRRDLYYYPDIGVTKSILIGSTGDILGLIKNSVTPYRLVTDSAVASSSSSLSSSSGNASAQLITLPETSSILDIAEEEILVEKEEKDSK